MIYYNAEDRIKVSPQSGVSDKDLSELMGECLKPRMSSLILELKLALLCLLYELFKGFYPVDPVNPV